MMHWTIHIRTVSLTNQREHWTKRHRRAAEQRFVVGAIIGNRIRGLVPCEVILTRIAPKRLDDDNLQGALKSVRDQIAQCLGVDDRDPRVGWNYFQKHGAALEHAVVISVLPKTQLMAKIEKTHVRKGCQDG